MWQRPHLLLLDEPTNHLDLDAVEIWGDMGRYHLDAVEALVFATCPRHVV